MRLGDLLGRLDRLQKSLWFKVVASALVVGLGLTVLGVQMVNVQRVRAEEARQTEAEGVATRPDLSDLPEEERKQAESYLEAIESTRRAARDLLSGRADSAGVAVGVATGIGLALAVVWIGQGLTGLVVLVLLAGICGPLLWYGNPTWRGVGASWPGWACWGSRSRC